MVTGLDLIECMLQRGCGRCARLAALQRAPQGASIEVRIYAEDPLKHFQPSPGVLTEVTFRHDVRVDGWVATGSEVSAFYDPMIAKLIVHGTDRQDALAKMSAALAATRLHGIATNIDYLRQVVATPVFRDGDMWTRMLDSFAYAPKAIEVIAPGTYSSVQDYPGRLGYWDIGVPPSGPMDDFAFRLANRIVGNHLDAAGLEFTLQGPTLRFHCDATIALTGARCPADLDGETVAYWQPVAVQSRSGTDVWGRAHAGLPYLSCGT
jgi:urea carboxylase